MSHEQLLTMIILILAGTALVALASVVTLSRKLDQAEKTIEEQKAVIVASRERAQRRVADLLRRHPMV